MVEGLLGGVVLPDPVAGDFSAVAIAFAAVTNAPITVSSLLCFTFCPDLESPVIIGIFGGLS